MKQFKSILYVTEKNGDQNSALERAVTFAENSQANLTIIDVIPAMMGEYQEDFMIDRRQFL